MEIKENEPLAPKTTMHIGGTARYFADLETKEDVEEAYKFAQEKNIPLIVLGAGGNTIFADGTIEALVVRIKSDDVGVDGNKIIVGSGKALASLINELADQGQDLSALTGIPGTVGGAIVGNAGQGPKGIWIDSFVKEVVVFQNGEWKTMTKEECEFAYRESVFKKPVLSEVEGSTVNSQQSTVVIWETVLEVPAGKPEDIKATIEQLLQKRIESQPHAKTAGSCFKATGGTPAWELIDKANLRGLKVGGIKISEKHANFLINEEGGSFEDVKEIIEKVQEKIPELEGVEMRLIGEDGEVVM